VSARPENPDAPTRQDAYLRALAAYIPELSITFGGVVHKPVSMRLVTPGWGKKYVQVWKSEEKGSDVNLAVHLVNDAWQKRYDCAVICSNDGDLAEALRIVRKELRKTVILAVPGDASVRPPSNQLRKWASYTMQIPTAALAECQLPNPIPGTTIRKPAVW
jgi:uncharacterized LabA/DUF88 family protein